MPGQGGGLGDELLHHARMSPGILLNGFMSESLPNRRDTIELVVVSSQPTVLQLTSGQNRGHSPVMQLFLTSIACNVLDQIAANLEGDPHELKVAFIPTASNLSESKEGTENDRNKLISLGFQIIDVDIAVTRHENLKQALGKVDVIFVGGGNTFYLLQEAHRSGFSEMLGDFVGGGTPYIGSSAGSVRVGTTIEPIKMMDDPKDAPELTSYDGLNFVGFVPLVHFGNEEFVEEYRTALSDLYSHGPRFILVRDNEYLIIQGDYWRICG